MNGPTFRTAKLPLGGYQELRVWQTAVKLAAECYVRTAAFPSSERYGLAAQMRSAAVSVVSNIAEGHGRGSKRAFGSFLSIAHGSLKELESQVILAQRLAFVAECEADQLLQLCSATGRMLHGLRKSLRSADVPADGRRPAADAVTA